MKKTKHTRKFKFVQFKQHREIVTPNKLALALREIEPTRNKPLLRFTQLTLQHGNVFHV